jgi:polysaccharide pyruvyl transferase WcaK-like protein
VKARFTIAQFGTFDVENYGDLLFPLLTEMRLGGKIPDFALQPVSPVGGEPVWEDCRGSISSDAFTKERTRYRGFLIGGGNIIRATPSDLQSYRKDPFFSYSNLWADVATQNENNKLPICWNSPGVPSSFPEPLRPLLRAGLERVDYLCVRDEQSRLYLQEVAPDLDIAVAPDPAWDVDKLWTGEILDAAYAQAFLSRKMQVPDRSIVIHLNSRYLAGAEARELARYLDRLCRKLEATGILIGIGPCHGDDVLAKTVAKAMSTKPLLVDRPGSLKEVAACIARSIGYIGSSMHGFITASAFGVPAVVVAVSSTIKFPGMLSQIGLPDLLQPSWPDAIGRLKQLDSASHLQALQALRSTQQQKLDQHWSKIAGLFQASGEHEIKERDSEPPSSTPYRMTLLNATAAELFERAQFTRKRLRARETQAEYLKQTISEREDELKLLKRSLMTQAAALEAATYSSALRRAEGAFGFDALLSGIRAKPRTSVTPRITLTMYLHYRLLRGRKDAADLARLAGSGFFDADYYIQHNPDVAKAGLDPLIHYIDSGAAEGRNPSSLFDTEWYLQYNPDVAARGINPLLHYVLYGYGEGRKPKPPLSEDALTGELSRSGRAQHPPKTRPLPDSYVVYTAIAGGYDDLRPPEFDLPNCRFIVLSDQSLEVEGWEVRPLNYYHSDPTRAARFAKLHPHVYFPDVDNSIWIDANIGIRGDIRTFFARLMQDQFLGIFLHPLRDCIYVEAEECIKRRKDYDHVIRRHIQRYRADGFPDKMGLWETNVLVRRHNDPGCIALMAAWWRELETGSRRDQLSLPAVAHRMSTKMASPETMRASIRCSPWSNTGKRELHPGNRSIAQAPARTSTSTRFRSISVFVSTTASRRCETA